MLHTDFQLPDGMAEGHLHLYRGFTWTVLLQSEGRDGDMRENSSTHPQVGLDLGSFPPIPEAQTERPNSGCCYFSN